MDEPTQARIVGGIQSRQEATRGTYGQDADPAGVVARIRIDRRLKSGKLDLVMLDEAELADLVAKGAAILATLAWRRVGER